MNLQELNELDIHDIASWPAIAKSVVILFIMFLICGLGYYLYLDDSINTLKLSQKKEYELKQTLDMKATQAANLPAYKKQMVELQNMLKEQLKQLPSKNEIATLIDDISYLATKDELKLSKIYWEKEINKQFYTELPMSIELSGNYNQIGNFIADLASLPRIVVLQNFSMKSSGERIEVKMQASTFRYEENTSLTKSSSSPIKRHAAKGN